jgi:hypothetical protein
VHMPHWTKALAVVIDAAKTNLEFAGRGSADQARL